MPKLTRSMMMLVAIHLVVTTIHGMAHLSDDVLPGPLDTAFLLLAVYILPVVAALLLWRQVEFAGAVLLALSMGAALIYGFVNHFLLPGADNVTQQVIGIWPMIFEITAVLLIPLEALGCLLGLRLIAVNQRTRSTHQI